MKYVVQIFTGGWKNPLYKTEDIIQRLDHVMSMIDLSGVIIGWNLDSHMYKDIHEFLKARGVKMYLWLPAFSEIGELAEGDLAKNLFGTSGNYQLQEGESFQFYCPSSKKNHDILMNIYDTYFADCGFEGVFLDKVRGQSFVTGAEDIFGCCCDRCKEKLKEKGCDIDDYARFVKDKGIPESLTIRRFDHKGVLFKYAQTKMFFKAKRTLCSEEVVHLIDAFHKKNLLVGLDLYAPFLCNLVGQDYEVLTKAADFVKPMMYRMTNAPAGVGFETHAFQDVFDLKDESYNIIDCMNVTGTEFLEEQLNAIPDDLKKKTYPGLEINYREDIARTDPKYIRKSIHCFADCGIEHMVLSWDVMLAPDSHIEAASEFQK